jgi:hypothetical protein
MAWRIVKQPNKLLASFSDIIDGFMMINMTEEEAVQYCIDDRDLGKESAKTKVEAGINDYKPWTLNTKGSGLDRWEDCIKTIKMRHGDDALGELEVCYDNQ